MSSTPQGLRDLGSLRWTCPLCSVKNIILISVTSDLHTINNMNEDTVYSRNKAFHWKHCKQLLRVDSHGCIWQ